MKQASKRAARPQSPKPGGEPEGPSPAWLRLIEKAKRSRQVADRLSTAQREAESSPERQGVSTGGRLAFHAVEDPEIRQAHTERGCPGCITPGFAQRKGWAVKSCKVLLTPLVECRATASAARGQHHYACTYWEHYPERTPF